jgi:hypothetical protein
MHNISCKHAKKNGLQHDLQQLMRQTVIQTQSLTSVFTTGILAPPIIQSNKPNQMDKVEKQHWI